MNLSEFLKNLYSRLPYTKGETDFFVTVIQDLIVAGLSDRGFVRTPIGNFKLVVRKGKRFRNINTKEIVTTPAKYEVVFIPNKTIQEAVNGKEIKPK